MGGNGSGVAGITGDLVDNTDPANPIIDIQVSDLIPSGGTTGQVLKRDASGNAVWQNDTDTNTTYTLMTEAEFNTGTVNTGRVVSPLSLNRDIQKKINDNVDVNISNDKLVKRTSTGQIKVEDAINPDEAITLGQFTDEMEEFIINDISITNVPTKAELNVAYPDALAGVILNAVNANGGIGISYIKLANDDWFKLTGEIVV